MLANGQINGRQRDRRCTVSNSSDLDQVPDEWLNLGRIDSSKTTLGWCVSPVQRNFLPVPDLVPTFPAVVRIAEHWGRYLDLIPVGVCDGNQKEILTRFKRSPLAGRVDPGQRHVPVFALHTYDLSRLAVDRDYCTTPLGRHVIHEAHITQAIKRRLAYGNTRLKLEANSATIGKDLGRGQDKFRHVWFSGG
jgi:hypothetical protein